ncbi:hypothetical protein NDU88_003713 [Pleurodeles waltl]|uniref:Uncharacterized protein n=1 Tax=Pleurodeles waltl TaxID=8319 RepID=A0AAV7M732_PLEWA|nr:hypothetical protein NDU88_003713 [Pleurodeles waltl]
MDSVCDSVQMCGCHCQELLLALCDRHVVRCMALLVQVVLQQFGLSRLPQSTPQVKDFLFETLQVKQTYSYTDLSRGNLNTVVLTEETLQVKQTYSYTDLPRGNLNTVVLNEGTSGQSVTQAQSHTTTEPPLSGNTTTALTQHTHTSVPSTHQSAVCPPLQGHQGTPQTHDNQGPGISGSGHTVQGTEAQANRYTGRTAVCQGEDRPRELTLQEALAEILGAFQHSQDTMGQILDNVQENRQLQDGQYQGIGEDLQAINNTLISLAGVLVDMANIMREAVTQQRAPANSQTSEKSSIFSAASGQEASPQDSQATSTPSPAEGEPPRKRSLRSREKPETIIKTPASK